MRGRLKAGGDGGCCWRSWHRPRNRATTRGAGTWRRWRPPRRNIDPWRGIVSIQIGYRRRIVHRCTIHERTGDAALVWHRALARGCDAEIFRPHAGAVFALAPRGRVGGLTWLKGADGQIRASGGVLAVPARCVEIASPRTHDTRRERDLVGRTIRSLPGSDPTARGLVERASLVRSRPKGTQVWCVEGPLARPAESRK